MSLTEQEEKALASLDQEAMFAFLQSLIEIPSITGTSAEADCQKWLAERLLDTFLFPKIDLWQIDLPSTLAHPQFPGLEVPRDDAWGLVGEWGNLTDSSANSLILNGHIDVVPVGDLEHWHNASPFAKRRENGRIYGRGTCDMKGGVVACLFAIKAIQDAGISLKGRVIFQSVAGEEDGGLGTFAAIQRGYRGDAAIIPEPTGLHIVPACAGALTFRLKVPGKSSHASTRKDGICAIEKFMGIHSAVRDLETRRNITEEPLMKHMELPYPLSIGTLRAGDWPSSVCDVLYAEGRIGVALDEDVNETRRQLEECLDQVNQKDSWLREQPATVEWFGGQFASGKTDTNSEIVRLIQNVHESVFGQEVKGIRGAPHGSDLRLMKGLAGIPTIHYGPGSPDIAHSANEFVSEDEMINVAKTLIVTILRFCGTN